MLFHSQAEGRLSGSGSRPFLGLNLSTEVAPCMYQPGFRGLLPAGLVSGRLEARFGWVGDYADRARRLEVQLQGIPGGGCWIFLRRED